jgi:hypothetical protein
MSPTYYAVEMRRLDEELEAARRAGDLPRMQRLLGEQTGLMTAMYGKLA